MRAAVSCPLINFSSAKSQCSDAVLLPPEGNVSSIFSSPFPFFYELVVLLSSLELITQ